MQAELAKVNQIVDTSHDQYEAVAHTVLTEVRVGEGDAFGSACGGRVPHTGPGGRSWSDLDSPSSSPSRKSCSTTCRCRSRTTGRCPRAAWSGAQSSSSCCCCCCARRRRVLTPCAAGGGVVLVAAGPGRGAGARGRTGARGRGQRCRCGGRGRGGGEAAGRIACPAWRRPCARIAWQDTVYCWVCAGAGARVFIWALHTAGAARRRACSKSPPRVRAPS